MFPLLTANSVRLQHISGVQRPPHCTVQAQPKGALVTEEEDVETRAWGYGQAQAHLVTTSRRNPTSSLRGSCPSAVAPRCHHRRQVTPRPQCPRGSGRDSSSRAARDSGQEKGEATIHRCRDGAWSPGSTHCRGCARVGWGGPSPTEGTKKANLSGTI